MKITLLGSLGNINRFLIPQLVKDQHQVTVITSNPERVKAIEELKAKAAVGSMSDQAFLTTTFKESDVVYLMISTNSSTEDLDRAAKHQGQIFKNAVAAANVPNVVDLSSIGTDAGPEAGALHAYSYIEEQLNQLSTTNVAFIRPVGFYSNLFSLVAGIRANHIITATAPETTLRRYVDPSDIADLAYRLISNPPTGHTVNYVMSDEFSFADLITQLKSALKLPDLKQLTITSDQYKDQLLAAHLPEKVVAGFVQMTTYSDHPNKAYADMNNHPVYLGKVKLADFVQTFTFAYNHPDDNHRSNTIVSAK